MANPELYANALDQTQQNRLLRAVYWWMMIGLFVSGITAWMTAHNPALRNLIFGNPYMIWVLLLVELALVVAISAAVEKISVTTARALFLLFSFVDGLTLGAIFLAFTTASIATTFFIAGLTFGAMSLYGYFTDSDLSGWGKYLFMALIGIIIAFVVNFFLKSPAVDWIVLNLSKVKRQIMPPWHSGYRGPGKSRGSSPAASARSAGRK